MLLAKYFRHAQSALSRPYSQVLSLLKEGSRLRHLPVRDVRRGAAKSAEHAIHVGTASCHAEGYPQT